LDFSNVVTPVTFKKTKQLRDTEDVDLPFEYKVKKNATTNKIRGRQTKKQKSDRDQTDATGAPPPGVDNTLQDGNTPSTPLSGRTVKPPNRFVELEFVSPYSKEKLKSPIGMLRTETNIWHACVRVVSFALLHSR
jgi:hypothetical protein